MAVTWWRHSVATKGLNQDTPTSSSLRIVRLKEELQAAQLRKKNAESRAHAASEKINQITARIEQTKIDQRHSEETRALQARQLNASQAIYDATVLYETQYAQKLPPLDIPMPDRITSASRDLIAAKREFARVDQETRHKLETLSHQSKIQNKELEAARQEMKQADHEIKLADADIQQCTRNLNLAKEASLHSTP